MNENINLCEILKDCPKGAKLWHSIHGEVTFEHIDNDFVFPIRLKLHTEARTFSLAEDGHYKKGIGDCLLWPSKYCRDWSKWKCPKPKFDPKTLQPFDKVLIRPTKDFCWNISLFSYVSPYPIRTSVSTICGECDFCIPFNEDTKHLLGTNYDAPEYYRYWED